MFEFKQYYKIGGMTQMQGLHPFHDATFSRGKAFNSHNTHFWGLENPRVVRRVNFQAGRYRGGPVNWPAQSHDLNPLDYYLWGYTSNIIYATEVDSPEELQRRICATGNQIISPNILGKGPECKALTDDDRNKLFDHFWKLS
ncbi:hypothetical protein D910_06042 [Dendroctonus ponderosae]|uniref:Uncharacterized protein n=1 Tax=Dendroctonus ponderosae TaxID=77166 RepID=U4U8H1_DENPD|nr:hypothetical protein D910_06042 [Dendroctonus ponderosae]